MADTALQHLFLVESLCSAVESGGYGNDEQRPVVVDEGWPEFIGHDDDNMLSPSDPLLGGFHAIGAGAFVLQH
ncbi:MAG: hypothetical protein RLY17_624 [Pseudomonadota bacterium]|jgi:hypothetical protein